MITDFTNPERKKWLEITKRPELDHKKIKPLVKKIFKDVNKNGDKSLYKYTKEFDKIWIHGYLHLLGYKHKKLFDYKIMSKKENLILNYFHKKN